MKGELPVLRVRMLGGEEITYGNLPILQSRNNMTRAMRLLMILLYSGAEGIARSKLLEYLYGREEMLNVANNLRVACHRLKKMLVDAGLPEYDYIVIESGIYRFDAPMKTEVDALIFGNLIEEASRVKNPEKKLKLQKEACRMYTGEFLKDLSGEEWVLMESMRYKEQYTEALQQVCDDLMERREYEEVLELCETACALYPFDEWQSVRIDCYMALNRYKEAFKEYEDTAKLFFEELGISPSEKMMNQLKLMSDHMSRRPQIISEIKDGLMEKSRDSGAYYCSLPSFRDGYRLIRRVMERSGQSVYLMLCTIMDVDGRPMENSEKLDSMSRELYRAIKNSLRRCDSFTRYSPTQFVILLVGTNRESCEVIISRIVHFFSRDHKSWGRYLDCYVSSVANMENESSERVFSE